MQWSHTMGGSATMSPPASGQTKSSQPASGGLKQQWNLKEPPTLAKAVSGEQDRKFLESIKAAMDPVNKCWQFTAANAEKSKHDPLVAERDNLYINFQATRAKIDPDNETKAKGEIEEV
jgi:hypothetical protein